MGLRQEQSDFMRALGKLIVYATDVCHYELTTGDTYPGKFKHSDFGQHPKGLAIDLNLFIEGHFQTTSEAHAKLGAFWKALGGSWGGDWNDGNHYSWGEGKKVKQTLNLKGV